MTVLDGLLEQGPARVLKNDRPRYMVMSDTELVLLDVGTHDEVYRG